MENVIETTEKEPETKKSGSFNLFLLIPVCAVLIIAAAYVLTLPQAEKNQENTENQGSSDIESNEYDLQEEPKAAFEQPVREKWFDEVRKINREEYKIIETAASNPGTAKFIQYWFHCKPKENVLTYRIWDLNTQICENQKEVETELKLLATVSETLQYFSLQSEQEIFSELPEPPENFSEIKFATERGEIATELITPEIYKQPEFLQENTFQKNGLKWWTQNNPSSWGTNGYGFYPGRQQTSVTLKDENSFSGWFIVNAGWGIQTWQGMKLEITENTGKDFIGITMTPNEFLLEPTFPKIHSNWVYKIEFYGTVSPDTPKGTYTIVVNPTTPSNKNKSLWQKEHINLYYDATSSVIPGNNMLEIKVNVE